MIFDRISLVDAYAALQVTEANEGKLAQILFNRTAYYGTKTNVRFTSVSSLKTFIETEFAYQAFDPNCECGTCNESIWQLLSFTVQLPTRRFVTFVNNLRGEFESAEGAQLNKASKDHLARVFTKNAQLIRLKKDQSCFGYIENQGKYVSPCDYIELIKTVAHDDVIKLYQSTRNKYGLDRVEVYVDKCNEGIIEKAYNWPGEIEEFPCSDFLVSDAAATDSQAGPVPTTTGATTTETTTLATTEATTEATTTFASGVSGSGSGEEFVIGTIATTTTDISSNPGSTY